MIDNEIVDFFPSSNLCKTQVTRNKKVSVIIDKKCLKMDTYTIFEKLDKLKKVKTEVTSAKKEVANSKFKRTSSIRGIKQEVKIQNESLDIEKEDTGSEVNEYTPNHTHDVHDDKGSMSDETYQCMRDFSAGQTNDFSKGYDRKRELVSPEILKFDTSFDFTSGNMTLPKNINDTSEKTKELNKRTLTQAPKSKTTKKRSAQTDTKSKQEKAYSENDDYRFDSFGGADLRAKKDFNSKSSHSDNKPRRTTPQSQLPDRAMQSDKSINTRRTSNFKNKRAKRIIEEEDEEEYDFTNNTPLTLPIDHKSIKEQRPKDKVASTGKRTCKTEPIRRRNKRKKIDEDNSFAVDDLPEEEMFSRQSSPFKTNKGKKIKNKKKEKVYVKINSAQLSKCDISVKNNRKTPLKKQTTPEFDKIIDRLIKDLANTLEIADITEWTRTTSQKMDKVRPSMPDDIISRDLSAFGIRKNQPKGKQKRFNEELWFYQEHNIPPVWSFQDPKP